MRLERGRAVPRKLCILVPFALVMLQMPAAAEIFRFTYTKGEQYHYLNTVNETAFINGRLQTKNDILNKVSVEVTETRGDSGYNVASFQTSTRLSSSQGTYTQSDDYESEFWRDGRGAFTIDDKYFMPVVRDVPLFPEGDVVAGQSWSAAGSEAHDFRSDFGVQSAFHFPIMVSYVYLRNEPRNGSPCAVITAAYTVFYKVPTPPRTTNTYPTRITGTSTQTFWWDLARKRLVHAEEKFDFIFTLATGDEVEFTGESIGDLVEVQPLDRTGIVGDIQKDLRQVPDSSVRADDQGVTITLDNVSFPANSATLLPAEQEKLRRIAEILKKYPGRDVLITGNTAAADGYTEAQHQALSEQRAKAVGDYLLSLGVRRPEQMTIRGMGDRAPVADNSTEQGRMKNRRVEITILEN
jgi:outer membrane protein OmpA-like peptidoglycan-associated protein